MADKFRYEYQAPTPEERREIQSIQNKYLLENPKDKKLKRLKSLDARVKKIPMLISIFMGVAGILVFGTGLTCILEWNLFVVGCIVMILGVICTILAYFMHAFLDKIIKNKYKPEILRLSAELLNEENEKFHNFP